MSTTSVIKRLARMLDGCNNTLPGNASLLLAGQSTPQPAIVQALTTYTSKAQAVADAKLAYAQALKARDEVTVPLAQYLDELYVGLEAYYGRTNPVLDQYGVPVKHPPVKLTTEQLAAKKAKAKATREARHTLGKKQKKAIKGGVGAPSPAASPVMPVAASPVKA